MLQVRGLRKAYGATPVIENVSFDIHPGDRVGLIGPNGAGKSTMLRCIAGVEQVDAGSVSVSPGTRLGYLAQSLEDAAGQSIAGFVADSQGPFGSASRDLHSATATLAHDSTDEALAVYDRALAAFEALGGYARGQRATAILDGLGLGGFDPTTPVASLSGGQKTRLAIVALLLDEPDLLLLDEPTNHLDVEALAWLEGFLRTYRGAALIVSHDRDFLDNTVTRVLYLDQASGTVRAYPGNYTDFAAAREREREQHHESWRRQQEYVGRVQGDIARLKGEALAIELGTTPRQPGVRKLAKRKAKLGKARERKLERFMAAGERVEKPKRDWVLKFDFGAVTEGSRAVVRFECVGFAYPDGPELFPAATFDIGYGERVAVVGPNGAGKTTLLRLMEGRLTPTSGRVVGGPNVRIGLVAQEHETLDPTRTVLESAQAERTLPEGEMRAFLHFFLFEGDEVFRRVEHCSPGERSRLQLALLVLRGCNLLLLDEPLNHLDIEGREHFERALAAFEGTVVAVAHDRRFLRSFAGRIIEVAGGRVRPFPGGYDDYVRWSVIHAVPDLAP